VTRRGDLKSRDVLIREVRRYCNYSSTMYNALVFVELVVPCIVLWYFVCTLLIFHAQPMYKSYKKDQALHSSTRIVSIMLSRPPQESWPELGA
jgi:hypothetical protein